ncbi:uroporphyrinogen-III synthase [Sphingomonas sp. H39-1-10]|uniref:uroporphyrinogen-III synthase n=1 Tax=Sphingomonas TaxID=13687 RepID=UPI000884BF68|nr:MULTISPECIES: uroporphyrinogen-III synthase [Sphingomonas]MDF0488172.1 uroporphyrinogen-III synthase [Sphingomonas pollutisoli]SDA33884.1 uroporphyrinogen-III synthase [Sphingomonas sp. NFR15]
MTRTLAVLRPEPGNAATAARAAAAGYAVLRLPLFAVVPLAWIVPDARAHDALVLTSANIVRMAGAGLADLAALPVIAVGEQTAAAARAAGLTVTATGSSDAEALAALLAARGMTRALHLGGRERTPVDGVTRAIAVYASEPRAVAPADLAGLAGNVALLHSARAATRLGELLDAAALPRARVTIGAFSAAIAAAAGPGWHAVAVAARPSDTALFAAIDALGR